jgi:hypothetical protein
MGRQWRQGGENRKRAAGKPHLLVLCAWNSNVWLSRLPPMPPPMRVELTDRQSPSISEKEGEAMESM